jgi:hypothetical protein
MLAYVFDLTLSPIGDGHQRKPSYHMIAALMDLPLFNI